MQLRAWALIVWSCRRCHGRRCSAWLLAIMEMHPDVTDPARCRFS